MNLKAYMVGSAIVWMGLILATAIILRGTPYFAQMLPILAGGAVWSIVLAPTALRRR